MSARGLPGLRLVVLLSSATTVGIANAMVLPLPVWPRPSTSRPARESGNVADWMGNGSVTPRAASAVTMGAGTPNALKEGDWVMGCFRVGGGR